MRALWGDGIVSLPSLRESYATELDIETFRKKLFLTEERGSHSPRVSQQQCYEILLGREDFNAEDDEEVAGELYNFSYLKWRVERHGAVPALGKAVRYLRVQGHIPK